MKASGFLHCALRSPDPVRIGKFYADLFECNFFIHSVPMSFESVLAHSLAQHSWPLDVPHVAFRVDRPKEEILELLTAEGIAARYEPRGPGLLVVGFDDPDGNFVELFPDFETMELPSEAFCNAENLDRVMAQTAARVTKLASLNSHGETTYPLVPGELKAVTPMS